MRRLLLALAALLGATGPAVPATPSRPWWKDAIVYQIYPRSFADSNGDGIGDLNGITAKLDYIKSLGVDVVWLNPHYQSPNIDNGYDISDYRRVMAEFGTMADFDKLLAGMKRRGLKLIIDLVVTNTSDRHPWFVEAAKGRENPYRDYYIWRSGRNGGPPNNWPAFFGGSAWQPVGGGDYYLHYWARQQPDLNWDNPKVRREVHDVMRFWLDKGVSGFRMDVIAFISKDSAFADLDPVQLKEPEFAYANGPRLHDHIQEMNRAVLSRYDTMTVGEAWGVTPAQSRLFTDSARRELDMVFQFDASVVGRQGWRPTTWTLPDLKAALDRIAAAPGERGWAANFLGNHDLPRALSTYGDAAPALRAASAKALAVVLLGQRGTPFLYQGDEIGMANMSFASIEAFRDISARNVWRTQVESGKEAPAVVLAALNRTSRDHARTPMQWDGSARAGFTTGTPWIAVNPDHASVNVAAAERDPASVLAFYRRLIAFRRADKVMREGSYRDLDPGHESVYAFERTAGDDRRTIIINMTSRETRYPRPVGRAVLVSEGAVPAGPVMRLAPWQAIIFAS